MNKQEALQWLVDNVKVWPTFNSKIQPGHQNWAFGISWGSSPGGAGDRIVFASCNNLSRITEDEWASAMRASKTTLSVVLECLERARRERRADNIKWAVENVPSWPTVDSDILHPMMIAPDFVMLVSDSIGQGKRFIVRDCSDGNGQEVVLADGILPPVTKQEWLAAQPEPDADVVTILVRNGDLSQGLDPDTVEVTVPLKRLQEIVAGTTA